MSYFYGMGYKLKLSQLSNPKDLQKLFQEHDRQYHEDRIRTKAQDDGKLGIPPSGSADPSPFERELVYACARLGSYVASRYKGPLELLDAKIKAEEQFIDRKYNTELQRIENIYEAEKHAAEDAYGLQHSHKQLETAEAHYNMMYERYKRAPVWYIPHWAYLILATVIFLGEIPLNALVFQIFGENQVMTWVMAFVIGLSIPVMAHFIGIKAREHGDGFSISNFLKAGLGFAVIAAAIYGISELRHAYLSEFKEQFGLTQSLVEETGLFIWLNLAVFCAAIVVSYLSHDSVPGFQEAHDNVRKARKFVEKKEARRVRALKLCAMARAEQLDIANREHHGGINRLNLLKGSYDQLLKEGQEFESRCLDRLMQDVSRYRHENLRARDDRNSVPQSFGIEHSFTLELEKMKEMLRNGEAPKDSVVTS